jgi:hypothetical protein
LLVPDDAVVPGNEWVSYWQPAGRIAPNREFRFNGEREHLSAQRAANDYAKFLGQLSAELGVANP